MVLSFASNDFFALNDFVCLLRNDYVYHVWQETKVVQYFWKTGAFKSLENPSIQTWIRHEFKLYWAEKSLTLSFKRRGLQGKIDFHHVEKTHDCSFGIGRNHISSWGNKILLCPARVCWKTFYSQSIDNIMIYSYYHNSQVLCII